MITQEQMAAVIFEADWPKQKWAEYSTGKNKGVVFDRYMTLAQAALNLVGKGSHQRTPDSVAEKCKDGGNTTNEA